MPYGILVLGMVSMILFSHLHTEHSCTAKHPQPATLLIFVEPHGALTIGQSKVSPLLEINNVLEIFIHGARQYLL